MSSNWGALALVLLIPLTGCFDAGGSPQATTPTETSTPTPAQNATLPPTSSPAVPSTPPPSPSPSASPTPSAPPPLTDVHKDFNLKSRPLSDDGWSITPAAVTVANNIRLEVTATNQDLPVNGVGTSHTWYIGAFETGTPSIPPGQNATVVFSIREAGTFPFWCTIADHRSRGMEGNLTVTA